MYIVLILIFKIFVLGSKIKIDEKNCQSKLFSILKKMVESMKINSRKLRGCDQGKPH